MDPRNMRRLASVLLGLTFFTSCSDTERRVHEGRFADRVGSVWRLKKAVYVVEFDDTKGQPEMLMSASFAEREGDDKTDESNIGNTYPSGVTIQGIVPADTKLRVVEVMEHESFGMGTTFHYMVAPEGELKQKWPKLDAQFLQETIYENDVRVDVRFEAEYLKEVAAE